MVYDNYLEGLELENANNIKGKQNGKLKHIRTRPNVWRVSGSPEHLSKQTPGSSDSIQRDGSVWCSVTGLKVTPVDAA